MKSISVTSLLAGGILAVQAATSPIFINNSPLLTPPQVDAKIFWNRSTINIFTLYPYQAQNVQFWTNNGVMTGSQGFVFQDDRSGKRARGIRANSRNLHRPSTSFYNDGNITGDPFLTVNARNVSNPGRLDSGEFGIISVQSTDGFADLSRGTIRAGPATGLFTPCTFLPFGTNFFAEVNVTGIYWGAGRNNALGTNGQTLNLANAASFFNPTFPQSPSHQTRVPGSTFTNTVFVPGFFGCGTNFDAFVHTNFNTPTSMVVNIVFAPAGNILEASNLNMAVRFAPNSGDAGFAYAPVVEFRAVDFDIVDQAFVTNYVTLMDTTAAETNVVLARPFTTVGVAANQRRPNTYEVTRGRFCSFDFAETANSVYDPGFFYSANHQTNVVNTIYAAYGAQVGQTNSQALTTTPIFVGGTPIRTLGVNPALSEPSNFAGRVEIKADRLNMANMRMRAENAVLIKANNVVSNVIAQVDAPFVSFDVQSAESELIIEKLAPATVNRLSGQIYAYSSTWDVAVTNSIVGTNAIVHSMRVHVLIVDNCLRSTTPVTLHRFAVRAPAVIVKDNLFVNASASINTRALLVDSNATLALPIGSDLAFTNVNNLLNFTNLGTVSVAGGAYFGTFDVGHIPEPPRRKRRKKPQVPSPLDNFVNRGAFAASALFVRATNAEISGTPLFPAFYSATQGVIFVSGSTVALSNITMTAGGDIELHANDLHISSSVIRAGISNAARSVRGSLTLDATNSFGDFGAPSANFWQVTAGVRVPTQPFSMGDLMGTRIYSSSGPFWETPFIWAAQDRGPVVEGFANNLAVGVLTLDAAQGNLLHFGSPGGSHAIYVDYLELLHDATNFNFAIGVDTNFTIYFADSNISPEKLEEGGGGRIRWVSQFTGPNSSTNITYPNGVTYTFNAGLVRSKDRDDDGDGVANAEDCTPLPVEGFDTTLPCPSPDLAKAVVLSTQDIGLTITVAAEKPEIILSWNAPAGSDNTVEFTDSIAAGTWKVLTNFINGPENARVTVKDAVVAPLRVYRVRVDAGKP